MDSQPESTSGTLVDQIIEVESSRLDYLRVQISDDQAKRAAWEEVRGLLQAIEDTSGELAGGSGLNQFTTEVLGANPGILSVSASEDATPGRHTVRILQAAQREVVGSSLQATSNTALGLTGQFVVGGRIIDVSAQDSLVSIASRINEQNFGAEPIGVSASVVGSDGAYRLVLSADETGAEGIGLLDVDGVLGSLGMTGTASVLKNRTSGGFASDGFSDSTTTVGSLLGFASGAPSGVVTLGSGAGAFTVSLDLGSQSLEGVRDAINAAAAGAGSSMFATVESDGAGGFRLDVTGTAAATDADGVLQALGVLAADTGAIAQVVQGDVLTTDAGGTLATAATALTSLYNGTSPAGAQVGDTILFEGRDDAGNEFAFTHTIQAGDTLQTLITRLEGAEGFNGGATVEVDVDGRLSVTSNAPGASLLSLSAFAGNEGGGILDLGTFTATSQGRARQISAGQDAIVEIDGALVTSSSNDIDDVVNGLTFSILGADPTSPLEVVVERDAPAGVESVTAFVDALNELIAFANNGLGVIGEDRPPLAGDVESIRAQAKDRQLICGVSGGVDSLVAAALVHRAVGEQLHCIFVDNGLLLRKDEARRSHRDGVPKAVSPTSELRAASTPGRTLPGRTRRRHRPRASSASASATVFIDVFKRRGQASIDGCRASSSKGTLYPDVIESQSQPHGGPSVDHQDPPQRRRPPRKARLRPPANPCATSSRTRCAPSAPSSACRTRWCGGSLSRGPGSRCASSARSPKTA